MDLSSGAAKLQFALRSLRVHWETAKTEWSDRARYEFEKNYWEPLELQVNATLSEIARLDQILARAQQECD